MVMYFLRRLLLAGILWLGSASMGCGQVFFGVGGPVPDFSGTDEITRFAVPVQGLPDSLSTRFGLEQVCLSLTHARTADLKIELLSPAGTSIWLTNRNGGGDGRDYSGTCFRMDGFNGYIYEGRAPFSGSYIPDGKLQFFNDGQNPNGIWQLLVHDLSAGETGTLAQVSLSFGSHPARPGASPCGPRNPSACQCPPGSDPASCLLLPDLIVSEKIVRELHREYAPTDATYPHQVRLAVATANIGAGPMHTRGARRWLCGTDSVTGALVRCPDGQLARQPIEQVLYQRHGDSLRTSTRLAGFNYYDERPGHRHFHADDWVEYTLRRRSRHPDPRRWPVIGRGTKASYCLFDSGNCGEADGVCQTGHGGQAGPATLPNFGFGHFVSCESDEQGISVGGIDNYGINFEGQHITLPPGTPNGQYYLVVTVDPLNRYQECDETNNTVVVPIMLRLQLPTRKQPNSSRGRAR
jgi:subtilisin-like proprotein convertase family protein